MAARVDPVSSRHILIGIVALTVLGVVAYHAKGPSTASIIDPAGIMEPDMPVLDANADVNVAAPAVILYCRAIKAGGCIPYQAGNLDDCHPGRVNFSTFEECNASTNPYLKYCYSSDGGCLPVRTYETRPKWCAESEKLYDDYKSCNDVIRQPTIAPDMLNVPQ